VFHNLLSYWDFHTQPFLGFTKNGVKREKHPVCGSPVGENALLMLEVRGECRIFSETVPFFLILVALPCLCCFT